MQNVQKNDSKNPEMVQKIAVQRNADLKPCRARKMLKNAPTLAIGGVDTDENEPSKVSMKWGSKKMGVPNRSCTRHTGALHCSALSGRQIFSNIL